MWLNDLFNKIFRKKDSSPDSIDSQIDSSPLKLDSLRLAPDSIDSSPTRQRLADSDKEIHLEKESVQLGLAAGYTSHLIRSIESSLNRIESLMVTKDWFEHKDKSVQILEVLEIVKTVLESHDRKTDEKFDNLHESLLHLLSVTEKAPEPLKSELKSEIRQIEAKIPLTSQMDVILSIIKSHGEISYKELTLLLGYKNVDSLRSYLSKMKRRGAEIEAFTRNNETWVRLESTSPSQIPESDPNLLKSNQTNEQTTPETQ